MPIADVLTQAKELLIQTARPDKIILFGSRARGDHRPTSDLDLLVILPHVDDPIEEMARLRLALTNIPMAIDLIVMSRREVEDRANLRGTMLYHALREGRVLHDSS